jgi:hypothetical protein
VKDINELAKSVGPVRRRELLQANDAYQAATTQLADLQQELAKHKQGQAALEEATLVTAGANVAALAQGMQLQSAHDALIAHLEKEAIPQAKLEVNRTGKVIGQLREVHTRKQATIEEQRRIIDRAQAELDKATGWLDT